MKKPIFSPYANSNIKNIIFDLGGVILNIDYNLTIEAFKQLGIKNFDLVFSQAKQSDIFDKLDKGLIGTIDFCESIRQLSNLNLKDVEIYRAWNAMLLNLPPERLPLLKAAKNYYRTYLLSNTNAIHFEAYNNYLKLRFDIVNLSPFFETEYYSHLIGMRKPEPEIFYHVLKENKLNPEETLFIDDSIQHVESAKSIGILAHYLDIPNGESIEKLFQ
jgi:glucose-1-phosphatase